MLLEIMSNFFTYYIMGNLVFFFISWLAGLYTYIRAYGSFRSWIFLKEFAVMSFVILVITMFWPVILLFLGALIFKYMMISQIYGRA